jgi:hypothetical protein
MVVIVFFGDDLSRRLGDYLYVYIVLWIAIVFCLLLLSLRVLGTYSVMKLIFLSLAVGYLSTVVAYIIAVVFDVYGMRETHKSITMDIVTVSLVFPFLSLRGWLFSLIFAATSLALNSFSHLRE